MRLTYWFYATITVVLLSCGAGDITDAPTAADSGAVVPLSVSCTPLSCEDIRGCGIVSDGCGGTLTCLTGCQCASAGDESACPSLPCMTATGCSSEGQCLYEAVICGGEACTCNTGGCSAEDLRSCGSAVCTAQVCDPQGSIVDGEQVFANACVLYEGRSCGTCDLGIESCSNEAFVCSDITLGDFDPARVECSDLSSLSAFVYLDPTYVGGDGDGSRAKPFVTFDEAYFAAERRNGEGVIVGGSPVFSEALILIDGISIHGGYSTSPEFARSLSEVPTWSVPASSLESPGSGVSPRLIGLRADQITHKTIVENIKIQTENLSVTAGSSGADNYGAYVFASPGLRLINVEVMAGSGGPASPGITGAVGPSGAGTRGGNGFGSSAVNDNCAALPNSVGGLGAPGVTCYDGSSRSGGNGGFGSMNPFSPGGNGASGAVSGMGGGAGGSSSYLQGASPGFSGVPGSAGMSGGANAVGGVVAGGFWLADNSGRAGGVGTSGHGGGGGRGGKAIRFVVGTNPTVIICTRAPSGGGGGAGGCGGAGGLAASPAGSSFGIMIIDTSGAGLSGGSYRAGSGGAGAQGGLGGAGAQGGFGGSAYPFNNESKAGAGGAGGAGGTGGTGGNSAGGNSTGVYCENSSLADSSPFFASSTPGEGGTRAGTAPGAPGMSSAIDGCPSN